MTTPTFTATDIVNFAANKDGVNIETAFDQLVGQRVVDAIQARKQEIASTMFNAPAEQENEPPTDDQQDEQPEEEAGEAEQPEQKETEESDENTQSAN